ncbi:hypothetical protein RRG08_057202 [Elysia crispata]|uniref:Uncharacterized protein n=1 Tax=Elysia crispata TaxID=231223 RepID=A0AAE0XWD3_9GAST|nr:hypothetical protein RRG08_057202 [Elysia crispata]
MSRLLWTWNDNMREMVATFCKGFCYSNSAPVINHGTGSQHCLDRRNTTDDLVLTHHSLGRLTVDKCGVRFPGLHDPHWSEIGGFQGNWGHFMSERLISANVSCHLVWGILLLLLHRDCLRGETRHIIELS